MIQIKKRNTCIVICESDKLTLKELVEQNKTHDELVRLRAAIREIYEVWAGSDGFICKTITEAYLKNLIEEMRDIAAAFLHNKESLNEAPKLSILESFAKDFYGINIETNEKSKQ